MKFIRYLNLFEKMTKVRTQHCFFYNSTIIFLVHPQDVSRAIGESGKNIKKLSQIMEKKVKIIPIPKGPEEIEKFILDIVYPVKFKSVEVKDGCVTISAGMQSRAALIGRNKTRLNEMKEILEHYFGIKELKIA
jgi:NusA-like KH domain protein